MTIACRTPGCVRFGHPAAYLTLGAEGTSRPVGGDCLECKQPTEGPDDAVLIVPPPHQVADGPDHRASAYSATAALLELTIKLPQQFRSTLYVDHDRRLSVHVMGCELADAAALADHLDGVEHTTKDVDPVHRHHHWDGARQGHRVRVVWVERIPAVTG